MTISLLLIAGDNEPFVAAATQAAKAAFPGASFRSVPSIEKALETGAPGVHEILAMREASTPDIERATQALDDFNLPRWAVVASGGSPHVRFAEVIPSTEWKPDNLARAFRAAMELHLVRRERDRLLGDLHTIGTRITHDLRTPIGGIMVATEALNESHSGESDSTKALVEPIGESVRDLVAILGQVSLLSKATARQAELQDFNMEKAASRAVMRVEARAAREGAAILRLPSRSGISSLRTRSIIPARRRGSRSAGNRQTKDFDSGSGTTARESHRRSEARFFSRFTCFTMPARSVASDCRSWNAW
jgi:signal transduction histidine kinase